MRIISEGVRPQDIEYLGKCYQCKTKYQFTEKDGSWNYDPSGREEPALLVKCPSCGHNAYYSRTAMQMRRVTPIDLD